MKTANFSHLDLAHIVGACAALLVRETDIRSFESLDGDELLAHQNSLLRGLNIVEVGMGALTLDDVNKARLGKTVRAAEDSAHLIHTWLVARAKESRAG